MNENEKRLLQELLSQASFRDAFRKLMVEDQMLAEALNVTQKQMVYVWCVECTNECDGKSYYHPIIVPGDGMMPNPMRMMDPEYYTMMYTMDQFAAYDYDARIDFMRSVYPNAKIRMIAIPEDTFKELQSALSALVVAILVEVERVFEHYDNIASLTHANMVPQKAMLLANIFGQISIVASGINKDMEVVDSTLHEYVDAPKMPENEDEDDLPF